MGCGKADCKNLEIGVVAGTKLLHRADGKKADCKGQVFALDLLISLIAATLAIGLLFHTMEIRVYDQKEAELWSDLQAVADTAGNMLVASNAVTCELRAVDGTTHIDYLNNCIDTAKINSMSTAQFKEALGIPSAFVSEYGLNVSSGGNKWGDPLPLDKRDFVEETRTVVLNNGFVRKDAFETHSFSAVEIKIRVWKA